MIILGLGSNLGDRLAHLRKALQAIHSIPGLSVKQVSPVYVSDALKPEHAGDDWDLPYLNLAIRCEGSIHPHDLLPQLKNIEWSIGRKPNARHWGPRVIDIDILAWDDLTLESETLTVPHVGLLDRPFALWPLSDVAPLWKYPLPGSNHDKTAAQLVEPWGSRFSGEAPFHTRQINQRIDTPQIVGVVNITPDSFSDGGLFLNPQKAVDQMVQLIQDGADVIDLGAESTSPTAQSLTHEEEWARLEPVLFRMDEIRKHSVIPAKISVDTRHYQTAEKALAFGVDWINDVSGLDNPAMREIISASNADCVVMHHVRIPERRDHVLPRGDDPVKIVLDWGKQRLHELAQQGIPLERIIFDPGIGFGKMAEQSLYLLQHVNTFAALGVRILIGHSRKTFMSLLCDKPFAERDIETLTMSLYLAEQPIDFIRVHNVEMCARGFRTLKAIAV